MKENNRTAIIVIILIAAIILVVLFFFNDSEKKFNWTEEYRTEQNEPYDVSLLKELSAQYFYPNTFKKIENLGPEGFLASLESSLLIYVNDYYLYDSLQTAELFEFVENGNSALIISSFPYTFHSPLEIDSCFREPENATWFVNSKKVELNIDDLNKESSAVVEYYMRGQAASYSWEIIPDSVFCSDIHEINGIGSLESDGGSYVNMLEIKYGKGSIIVNTTPLAFSNFNLRNEDVLSYVENIYGRLPSVDVYWSEYDYRLFGGGPQLSESPLRWILSQTSLKWAWYISLFLILLYVVFNSRRKQKLIPLMEGRTNNSPNYVDAISRLYKLQGSHSDIIKHQEELLLSFLRDKYKIHTLKLNEEFYRETERKTSIPAEEIKSLFYRFDKMKHNSTISDEQFLKMNSIIKNFYDKCE